MESKQRGIKLIKYFNIIMLRKYNNVFYFSIEMSLIIIVANTIEHLLCVKHCSKHLAHLTLIKTLIKSPSIISIL